jgi:PncC family amidohydrolase
VGEELLATKGAVSSEVAKAMAAGARALLKTDVAVSVTGLAGPGGDEFGNCVGTVFIGYADKDLVIARHFLFDGDREAVRQQAIAAALQLILEFN